MDLITRSKLLEKISLERIDKFYESDIKLITDIVQDIKSGNIVDIRDYKLTPASQLLFIEEGSVDDLDNIIKVFAITNPQIKIITYKRGCNAPILQCTNSIK